MRGYLAWGALAIACLLGLLAVAILFLTPTRVEVSDEGPPAVVRVR